MRQTMAARQLGVPPSRRGRGAMSGRHICIRAAAMTGGVCLAAGALVATSGVSAAATPAASSLNGGFVGVSASSATNAWAVGFRFGGLANRTLTEHWNGRSWKQVKSLNPGGVGHEAELLSVSVLSRNNAWAVGYFSDG